MCMEVITLRFSEPRLTENKPWPNRQIFFPLPKKQRLNSQEGITSWFQFWYQDTSSSALLRLNSESHSKSQASRSVLSFRYKLFEITFNRKIMDCLVFLPIQALSYNVRKRFLIMKANLMYWKTQLTFSQYWGEYKVSLRYLIQPEITPLQKFGN